MPHHPRLTTEGIKEVEGIEEITSGKSELGRVNSETRNPLQVTTRPAIPDSRQTHASKQMNKERKGSEGRNKSKGSKGSLPNQCRNAHQPTLPY
jgi:hypothetical protein